MKNTKSSLSINLWQRYTVLIIALFVLALSPAYAEQLTSGVSFSQISFTASIPPQMYSRHGQMSVDFTMLYGEGYINVERYQNGQPAGWVVKNLPVVNSSILSGFSTMFDLGASGYQSSFAAYVNYSTSPLADDSSLKNQAPVTYQLGQAEYSVLPADTTVTGKMTYKSDNAQDEKDGEKYCGTYTFKVTTAVGPPAEVTITQSKGPLEGTEESTDGYYAIVPATYDKKTKGFTFDPEKPGKYYDKKGNLEFEIHFGGSFVNGKLNFTAKPDGVKYNGTWTFKND